VAWSTWPVACCIGAPWRSPCAHSTEAHPTMVTKAMQVRSGDPDHGTVQQIALSALEAVRLLCALVSVHKDTDPSTADFQGAVQLIRNLPKDAPVPARNCTYEEFAVFNASEYGRSLRSAADLPLAVLERYGQDNLAPVAAGRFRSHSAVVATAALSRWWLGLGAGQPTDDAELMAVAWEMAEEILRGRHNEALRVQVSQECWRVAKSTATKMTPGLRVTYREAVEGRDDLGLPRTPKTTLTTWCHDPKTAADLGVIPKGKVAAQQPLVDGLLRLHAQKPPKRCPPQQRKKK